MSSVLEDQLPLIPITLHRMHLESLFLKPLLKLTCLQFLISLRSYPLAPITHQMLRAVLSVEDTDQTSMVHHIKKDPPTGMERRTRCHARAVSSHYNGVLPALHIWRDLNQILCETFFQMIDGLNYTLKS